MEYLVTAINTTRGWHLEGARNVRSALQFRDTAEDIGGAADYQFAQQQQRTWVTDEPSLPGLIEFITTHHVGVEVKIFKLERVVTRTPGPLVEKAVTKDGILPV